MSEVEMTKADFRLLVDGTPLLGTRTGIGRYTTALLTELASMSAMDTRVAGFTVRGWRELHSVLPRGARVAGPPMPARAIHTWSSRFPFPPIEMLTGGMDLVHGTNFVLPPTMRARGVVTVHDLAFLEAPEELAPGQRHLPELTRRSVRRAAVVCTPTAAVADVVAEKLGVRRCSIVVTPLGVDRSWFHTEPPGEALRREHGIPPRYVIFVGGDHPRKGLSGLLRAHAESPDLPPLVLAGLGTPYRTDRTVRTGYLPDPELRQLIAGADALVMPSRDEGFGLPALEAFACGVPVVCTDIPALREVTGNHAALFPFNDHDALREALHRALAEAPTASDARREHAASYTWRACAEATAHAYQLALAR